MVVERAGARRRAAATLAGVVLFAGSGASAQAENGPAPETASGTAEPAAPTDPKLEEAKQLFRKGNALRDAGDYERALDYYRRSRALVPSVPNTLNAALSLDHLGRYDEALEAFEQLVVQFASQLDREDRATIGPAMEALREKLGRLDVSSNVHGVLLVDGRERGSLPLQSPVPVLPGERVVRVLADGYETFEQRVAVRAKKTVLVDAKLRRLTRVGKLRVEDPELAGADLYIDGAVVGRLPWEGTLAPGEHLYFVRRDDVGSAPRRAVVVEGQTVLLEVKAGPLGPEMAFVVEPQTAALSIDGVALGDGGWQGRLPIGEHRLEAREVGYFASRRRISIGPRSRPTVRVALRVNEDHPRWAKRESWGHPWLDLFAGYGLSTSLGSDAEADCTTGACNSDGIVTGPIVGARGGWQLPIGISGELDVGLLSLSTTVTRSTDPGDAASGVAGTTFELTDHLRLGGPFVSAGASYLVELDDDWRIGGRVHIGTVFAAASDSIDARAEAEGRSAPAEVDGSGSSVRTAALFLQPEVGVKTKVGPLEAGAGIAAFVFPTTGPRLDTGETRVITSCDRQIESFPACAKNSRATTRERGFSQFAVLSPNVTVGYPF